MCTLEPIHICRGGVRGEESPGFLVFDPRLHCVSKHLLPQGESPSGTVGKPSAHEDMLCTDLLPSVSRPLSPSGTLRVEKKP